MDINNAFKEKAQAKMEEVDAQLQLLEAKAKDAKADQKIKYEQKLQELQEKRKELSQQLESLKTSSSNAFETLQQGFESAWEELDASLKLAKEEFFQK
ncbi:MAG: hypothetical protein ACQERK_01205 [Campylobacterota bacterium]